MTQRFMLLLFCFVLISEYANGYLIKGRSFDELDTKEIPVLKEELGNRLNDSEMPAPEIFINRKCAAAGEFCINHKDCCSNSCLGYLRRCVS